MVITEPQTLFARPRVLALAPSWQNLSVTNYLSFILFLLDTEPLTSCPKLLCNAKQLPNSTSAVREVIS